MKLHDYQQRAIDFVKKNHHVYLMMDLGLGKTAVALKAIEQSKHPAVVFAPLRVCHSVWPKEIKKWCPNLTYTILHGKDKDVKLSFKRDIYLVNYDGLKWFFNACVSGRFRTAKKLFLVLDESTFVKNPSTKRFKMFEKMRVLFSNYKLCLSATPAPNGLHELWSQYKILDGGKRLLPSYYKYRDTFFTYSGAPVYKTTIIPGSDKKIYQAISDITFRLDAKDYIKLPPVIYNAVNLQLPDKLRKTYEKFERDFFLDFSNQNTVTANATVSMSIKLRQMMQGGMYLDGGGYKVLHMMKIEALKEIIETNPGKNILCPIQFKFELDMIKKELGNDIPIIAGGTSTKDALYYEAQWNLGNIPLLLCHPQSVGFGLNLQEAGDIILWFGLTWSLMLYQQLIGRLVRQGRKKPVIVNHLVFDNTVDVTVMQALSKKDATQQDLLDTLRDYGNATGA